MVRRGGEVGEGGRVHEDGFLNSYVPFMFPYVPNDVPNVLNGTS